MAPTLQAAAGLVRAPGVPLRLTVSGLFSTATAAGLVEPRATSLLSFLLLHTLPTSESEPRTPVSISLRPGRGPMDTRWKIFARLRVRPSEAAANGDIRKFKRMVNLV